MVVDDDPSSTGDSSDSSSLSVVIIVEVTIISSAAVSRRRGGLVAGLWPKIASNASKYFQIDLPRPVFPFLSSPYDSLS